MAAEALPLIRQVTSTWCGTARLRGLPLEMQDDRFGLQNLAMTGRNLRLSTPLGKIPRVHVDAVAYRPASIQTGSCACSIDPLLKMFTGIFTSSNHRITVAVSRVKSCMLGRSTRVR